MKRREFITLIGGTVAAWPLVALAQQRAKMKRIAMVSHSDPVAVMVASNGGLLMGRWRMFGAFFDEVSRAGYVEGKTLLWKDTPLRDNLIALPR